MGASRKEAGRGLGVLLRKAAIRESSAVGALWERCGSSGGASVGRTSGDLEQPGEGRERPAPHRWSSMGDTGLELGVRIPGRAEFWGEKTTNKTSRG